MVNWIVVGIVILLVVIFLKFTTFKHRTYTFKHTAYVILVVAFLLFLYISVSHVIKNANFDLKTFEGWMGLGKIYLNWLVNIGGNVKELGGQAIKMDWVGNVTKP